MTGAQETQRAPHTIIYVPGLSRDAQNTGEAVTASIRSSADLRGERFVVETAAPAPEGLRATGAIVDRSGNRLVDVYELDYRRTLERLDRDGKGEEQPPGLASALYYAALAWWLWWKAFLAHRKPTKSRTAGFHLFFGLVVVAATTLVAALVIWELAAALLNRVTDLDLSIVPASDAVLWGGLLTGAMYLAARKNLLRATAQVRRVLRYHDEPAVRQRLTAELAHSIDDLLDEGYDGPDKKIHLLAYSFGSSLVLDSLLVHKDDDPRLQARIAGAVASLVTVGCPYDAERVFYRHRLRHSVPLRPDLAWRNVFIASDLFGSNFRGREDAAGGTVEEGTPGGLTVRSIRYLPDEELTFWGFLRFAAFRHHNQYWHERGGCWADVLDLWGLAEALPARVREPAPQDVVPRRGSSRWSRTIPGLDDAVATVEPVASDDGDDQHSAEQPVLDDTRNPDAERVAVGPGGAARDEEERTDDGDAGR